VVQAAVSPLIHQFCHGTKEKERRENRGKRGEKEESRERYGREKKNDDVPVVLLSCCINPALFFGVKYLFLIQSPCHAEPG
jgi:hypothetical protein